VRPSPGNLEVSILSSRARCSRWIASGIASALVLAAGLVGAARPAAASPETLKRSVSNLLMSPLDVAFSPYVSGKNIYNNLQNVDDTMPVRIAWVIPGYAWDLGVQVSASCIRAVSGALEFLPGIGLFFFQADMDPLFGPVEKSQALVDFDTPPINFKFGVTYTE